MDIDTSTTTVKMLKDAIKAENRDITCPGQAMRLFLARKDGTAWLKVKDLIKMHKGENSTEDESSYMVEELEAVTEKIYEKLPNPIPDEIIHVLVVAPTEGVELRAVRPTVQSLAELAFSEIRSKPPPRTQDMKKQMVAKYQRDCEQKNENDKSMLLCMVMNIPLPSSVVIASHIFQRKHVRITKMVGIENIDDVINGLLLFKPIEQTMDDFDIAFVRNEFDQLTLRIFNPDIKEELLVDSLTDEQWKALGGEDLEDLPRDWRESERPLSAPYAPDFDVLTTFGELNGKTLQFPSDFREQPFRCLYFQAYKARAKAITKGWVQEDYTFDDFSAEGIEMESKMQFFFGKISGASGSSSP